MVGIFQYFQVVGIFEIADIVVVAHILSQLLFHSVAIPT